MTAKISTKNDIKIIKQYKNNISIWKIMEKYNFSRSHLYKILQRNNVEARTTNSSRARIHNIDENFLDIIDSEEKAYFLGFFCADGYNSVITRSIRIKLAKVDKEILEKFKKLFSSNKPLYFHKRNDGQDQYEFALCSKYLSDRLIKLGIEQQKTKNLSFPNFIPNELLRHFIRGYFDGDGCIGLYKKNITSFSLVATGKFCLSLKQYIEDNLGIHCTICKDKNKYSIDVRSLCISGNTQIYKILNYLYEDSNIYLKRKYKKYKKFLKRKIKNDLLFGKYKSHKAQL